MPCYTVQIAEVALGRIAPDLLAGADAWLASQGVVVQTVGARTVYRVGADQVTREADGRLWSSTMRDDILAEFAGRLKGAVARAAVMRAAKAQGWKVRQTGLTTFEVIK